MANISLKKDYMDGNVLYGKDLNPNFELLETTINANDDAQSETNASVNENLTQLSSDMAQAKTDISEMKGDIADLETVVLTIPTKTSELENDSGFVNSSAIPTKVSDLTNDSNFVSEDAVPTKISQLENDDNTVKDADYVHTDNNYTDDEKAKLAGLSNYVLPMASSNVLGGVKIGEGLTRESDGTINVTGGGTSGDGIPTIIGTQEKPIELYNFSDGENKVPLGLAYISGYTKEISTSEANNNYDGCLLYTSSSNQFIGPYYEELNSTENLVFWFRPKFLIPSSTYFSQEFKKFTYNSTITNTEQGYVTPKAVYDYVGALTSLNTTDKTSIVNAINEIIENAGGENGATFTPDVSSDGTLSWTNDKNLPNPDPVNIKGPQGDTGADGQGVPTGGTEGQVLAKNSATDFDTVWKTIESGGGSLTHFKEITASSESPINFNDLTEPGVYFLSNIKGNSTNAPNNTYIFNNCVLIVHGSTVTDSILGAGEVKLQQIVISKNTWSGWTNWDSPTHGFIVRNMRNNDKNTWNPWKPYIMIADVAGSFFEFKNVDTNVGTVYNKNNIDAFIKSYIISTQSDIKNNALNDLQTTDKSSLIAAINELKTRVDNLESQI